ncbi:MAG: sigma 54-interacting transcriptional regulator [Planctomycetes bacterium]|nr:sigma 54-interacting transcriptional regulator [Planctomycetota bacterium]
MRRIDKVLSELRRLPFGGGITALDLASRLKLTRANVSSDLNQLCREGKAEKKGNKPVLYYPAALEPELIQQAARSVASNQSLESFLQVNPSLYSCGEQAKAAVLYPPHGMHMLLLGETGTGKSMFARLVYDFAVDHNVLKTDARFVKFNCADYAHNPQLLIGQLFGSRKGAYTGADVDKPGFLEQADGGILFLDEIHRLPPEGQEMLFTFLDHGVYRRLGETEEERTAQVLLICATTEDLQAALLTTFARRIPMIIQIPNLEHREIEERLTLISGFFVDEANRLGHPVDVSVNTIRSLMSYYCPGNIGQLRTDIQLICAKAYVSFISGRKSDISISSFDLPDAIREGLYLEKTHRYVYRRLAEVNKRFITFHPGGSAKLPETGNTDTIYKLIERRSREMEGLSLSPDVIQEEIEILLHQYYERVRTESRIDPASGVERMVGPRIGRLAKKLLAMAEMRLGHALDINIRFGLAIHLQNAIKRVQEGKAIVNPQLYALRSKYPRAFEVGLECLEVIKEEIGSAMPVDEAGYLAIFFSGNQSGKPSQRTVEVLVAAHGVSTARSMAGTVNRLLGREIVTGFDASLDESPNAVFERILDHLRQKPDVKEVLLLVDMGSLADFARQIESLLEITVKCIRLVSTAHVLEAGRMASLQYPLHHVWQQTNRVHDLVVSEQERVGRRDRDRLYIVTICTTGEGTARLLKEVLTTRLDLTNRHCEIQSLKMHDEKSVPEMLAALAAQGKVIAVVSALPLAVDCAFFRLVDILNGAAIPELQKLINVEATYSGIRRELFGSLDALVNTNAFEDINQTLAGMEQDLGMELDEEMHIGMLCHMGCMLDRLLKNEPVSVFQNAQRMVDKYPDVLPAIKRKMAELGEKYGVTVPLDEVCYATAFFMKESLLS